MNSNDLSAYKELFVKAARKHLEDIEASVALLKTGPQSPNTIDNLYLHLHSLKGECGVMNYGEIAKMCENGLSFLKLEKENPTNSENVLASISKNIESIKSAIDEIESKEIQKSSN